MVRIVKWLSHKMGFKIAMIKIGGEIPGITIDGDKELLRYVDITGYTFKKDPLSRIQPHKTPTPANIPLIIKLTPEQLKEVGL